MITLYYALTSLLSKTIISENSNFALPIMLLVHLETRPDGMKWKKYSIIFLYDSNHRKKKKAFSPLFCCFLQGTWRMNISYLKKWWYTKKPKWSIVRCHFIEELQAATLFLSVDYLFRTLQVLSILSRSCPHVFTTNLSSPKVMLHGFWIPGNTKPKAARPCDPFPPQNVVLVLS